MPVAATVKVALAPGLTAWFAGCWVIVTGVFKLRLTPALVTVPTTLPTSTV